MKAYYNKIDAYFLSRHPRLWVLGVHIFIPIVGLTFLSLIIIGAIIVNTSTANLYELDDKFERIAVGMVLPVILLVILFVLRQAKYNSIRVHQYLPFKNRFGFFIAFWSVLFGITSLPFATYFGSYFAPGINHSKKSFHKDYALLEKNMSHFYLKSCFTEKNEPDDQQNEKLYIHPSRTCDYRLEERWDTSYLNILRYNWDYARYYNGSHDRITLDKAREEIAVFIDVAKKYKARFKTEDVALILEMNLTGNGMSWEDVGWENKHYTHLENLSEFERSVDFTRSYHNNRQIFRMFEWKFWRYYCLVGFSLAFLLIIYCSVDKGDFGWAMLVCALFPTVFGIVTGLLALFGMMDSEESVQLLLALFVGALVYVAFMSNFKPKVKRIFGLSLNIILPLAIPFITSFDSFDEDEYLAFAFVIGVITTYLFSFYYQYQYLHPKKS